MVCPDQFSADRRRRASIEGDRLQIRKFVYQLLYAIVLGDADCLIKAAGPDRGADYVP